MQQTQMSAAHTHALTPSPVTFCNILCNYATCRSVRNARYDHSLSVTHNFINIISNHAAVEYYGDNRVTLYIKFPAPSDVRQICAILDDMGFQQQQHGPGGIRNLRAYMYLLEVSPYIFGMDYTKVGGIYITINYNEADAENVFADMQEQEQEPAQQQPLRCLPRHLINEVFDLSKDGITCPVCLDVISNSDELEITECGHKFCSGCVSRLDQCAICRSVAIDSGMA